MPTKNPETAGEAVEKPKAAAEQEEAFVPVRAATAGSVLACIAQGATGMTPSYLAKLPKDTMLTIKAYLPLPTAPCLVPEPGSAPIARDQDYFQFQVPAKQFLQQCLGRVTQGAAGGPVEVDALHHELPKPPTEKGFTMVAVPDVAAGLVATAPGEFGKPADPETAVPEVDDDLPNERQLEQQAIMDMPRWCLWLGSQGYGQSHALLTQCHKAQAIHAYARRINRPV